MEFVILILYNYVLNVWEEYLFVKLFDIVFKEEIK